MRGLWQVQESLSAYWPSTITPDSYVSDEQVATEGVGFPVQYPRVPGHEIVGDVVAVPPSEKIWKLGQRVGAGWHGGHCLSCPRCRIGDYITCEKTTINGALPPLRRAWAFYI